MFFVYFFHSHLSASCKIQTRPAQRRISTGSMKKYQVQKLMYMLMLRMVGLYTTSSPDICAVPNLTSCCAQLFANLTLSHQLQHPWDSKSPSSQCLPTFERAPEPTVIIRLFLKKRNCYNKIQPHIGETKKERFRLNWQLNNQCPD